MLVYGTALFNGDGVPEDRVRAYALVSRAAAQGLAPARTTLDEMNQLIPLEERQKGVALAQQLVNSSRAASKTSKPAPVKVATASAARLPTPVGPSAAASGAFRIQLGAFSTAAAAQRLFAQLSHRLRGARMSLIPSGAMTRLQAGPYATRADAAAACAALKPQPCFPVPAR